MFVGETSIHFIKNLLVCTLYNIIQSGYEHAMCGKSGAHGLLTSTHARCWNLHMYDYFDEIDVNLYRKGGV